MINFWCFLVGYAFSMSGNWLRIAAVGWIIKDSLNLTNDWYACYGGICAIVGATISPLASSIVRHGSRKLTLVWGNALLTVNALLFAATCYLDSLNFQLLLMLGLFSYICHCFTNIAEDVFVAEITPTKNINHANHLLHLSAWGTRLIFVIIAGFILKCLGPAMLFVFDSISFAIMLVCLSQIKLTKPSEDLTSPKKQFKFLGMFRFAYHDCPTRMVCSLRLIVDTFAFISWFLLPEIVRDELKGSSVDYTLIIGLSAIGGILSLAGTWYFHPKKNFAAALFVIYHFVAPFGLFLVGISPTLFEKKWAVWAMALGYGIAIFASCPVAIACRSYFQKCREPEYGVGSYIQSNTMSFIFIWIITTLLSPLHFKSSHILMGSCVLAVCLLVTRFLAKISDTKTMFRNLFWRDEAEVH